MSDARPVGIFTPHEGAHYLHRQTSAKVPRRFVFFDTEAYGAPHRRRRAPAVALGRDGHGNLERCPKDLDQSQAGSSHHP